MARCSYCSRRGHTKTTCSKLVKFIEDNPNSFESRENELLRERRLKKSRKCSYCKEYGHVRPTCVLFKTDSEFLINANMGWRRHMLDHMHDIGMGPGTLLRVTGQFYTNETSRYEDRERLVMIESIQWERIHFASSLRLSRSKIARQTRRAIKGIYVDGHGTRSSWTHSSHCWVPLPYIQYVDKNNEIRCMTDTKKEWEIPLRSSFYHDKYWEIVSPISQVSYDIAMVGEHFLTREDCREAVIEYLNDDPYSNNAAKKRSRAGVIADWPELSEVDQEKN